MYIYTMIFIYIVNYYISADGGAAHREVDRKNVFSTNRMFSLQIECVLNVFSVHVPVIALIYL
jgi:hypothetical protein